jgi:hypothetical protein
MHYVLKSYIYIYIYISTYSSSKLLHVSIFPTSSLGVFLRQLSICVKHRWVIKYFKIFDHKYVEVIKFLVAVYAEFVYVL